ncbi:MAG: penicillin-binding transpeptidase domain-containing protein, partial [Gammaproteobacteria bacterium]
MKQQETTRIYPFRRGLIVVLFILASSILVWRGFYLQILNQEFLRNHGDARSLRVVKIPAHRGIITDRNNEPLAISTPVDSIWAIPRQVLENPQGLPELARLTGMETDALIEMLKERIGREFVYLKRRVSPDLAREVEALGIYGVYLQQEFKRYYPAGEVTAHLVGVTNIDDSGQEGIELAFDHWLKGEPGEKRVLKDRLGRTIRDIESISPASPGNTLALSVDRRVQYLAYRELATAVKKYKAKSGSLVMLDPETGEVIAVVAFPSYNPNNRSGLRSENFRNRAITDVFEPGSTLKPFTAAAALMSGQYKADTVIDTNPGTLRVSSHLIQDISNFGELDVTGIIQKSSNVGASKIALSIGPEPLWQLFRSVGFGEPTGSGFPGESPGILANYSNWRELDLAAAAFGHGLAVTALQLAQAYAVIAADGILRPVTF